MNAILTFLYTPPRAANPTVVATYEDIYLLGPTGEGADSRLLRNGKVHASTDAEPVNGLRVVVARRLDDLEYLEFLTSS